MSKSNIESSVVVEHLVNECSAELFTANSGFPVIKLKEKGRVRAYLLKSSQWKDFLLGLARRNSWKISEYHREEILAELISMCAEGPKREFPVRVGRSESKVIIDLNDDSYDAVHISKNGVKVCPPDSVAFLRPSKQLPLPRPSSVEMSTFLKEFKAAFPVGENRWLLILAFILKCLHRDDGSYVHLVIDGGQGAGKSIMSKRLKGLIDPAEPWSYSPPNKNDDIIVAAFHSFLLVFDNMSGIDRHLADTFCRLSTGGGISKRRHFEDHDEAFYKLHRPCALNGIDEPTNRPDFVDRCISIELKAISDEKRVAETELERQFQDRLPLLLGGTYELLSRCLKVLPEVQTTNLPRMTDYARMGIAIEKVLKLRDGVFLDTYLKNRSEQVDKSFWNDDMCAAIHQWLERHGKDGQVLEGTAIQLRDKLFSSRRSGAGLNAPRSAKAFSGWLKRVEPLLNSKGILVERLARTAKSRTILIRWLDANPAQDDEAESYDL